MLVARVHKQVLLLCGSLTSVKKTGRGPVPVQESGPQQSRGQPVRGGARAG